MIVRCIRRHAAFNPNAHAMRSPIRQLSFQPDGPTTRYIPGVAIPSENVANLESLPEYNLAKEANASKQYQLAFENFDRALEVCNSTLGETSFEASHVKRGIINVCYSTGDYATAGKQVQELTKMFLANPSPTSTNEAIESHKIVDSLRAGRYFLHCGETTKVFGLDRYLNMSISGKVCLAVAMLCQRDYTNAMRLLDSCNKSNPSDPLVLNTLAACHLLEGGADAPENALRYVEEALLQFNNSHEDPDHIDRKAIEAHLLCNVGVLKLILRQPEQALDPLHNALKALESINEDESQLLLNNTKTGRVLAQLGAYYHITEQAVTSEGLHRSALENLEKHLISPRQNLIYSHCLDLHGSLLRDWDNREADARTLFTKAEDVRTNLTETLPDDFIFLDGWGGANDF
eukprot:g12511.t1